MVILAILAILCYDITWGEVGLLMGEVVVMVVEGLVVVETEVVEMGMLCMCNWKYRKLRRTLHSLHLLQEGF